MTRLGKRSFASLASRYPGVGSFRSTLAVSAKNLLDLLEFEKSLDRSSERLGQYSGLRLSEDSSDATALDREGTPSIVRSKDQ
jgi:oligoendopeptidase F